MSFYENLAILHGNVASEPELKFTSSGTPVINFSVATNRSIKDEAGQYKDVATFHRIVVWGKFAEWLGSNLKKGAQVFIKGRIDNRSYDKPDGTKGYVSEIVAESVIPARTKAGVPLDETQAAPTAAQQDNQVIDIPDDINQDTTPKETPKQDDIPFQGYNSHIELMNEPYKDKELICKDCGTPFVFSAGEQDFFKKNDYQEPKRCLKCRRLRKMAEMYGQPKN